MKAKLLIITVFFTFAIMGFVLSSLKLSLKDGNDSPISVSKQTSPPPVNNRWLDSFYIGAINSTTDCGCNYIRLDSLNFNLWHNYLGIDSLEIYNRYTPRVDWMCDTIGNDKLLPDVSSYASRVKGKIDGICRNNANRKLLMSRPKIDWLCYGQRSDYQCEPVITTDDLWFYSFNDHHPTAEVVTDSGNTVIHCRTYPYSPVADNPDTVVKRLKANTEQSRDIQSGNYGNAWMGDSQSDWIIKPRIRIDSTVAHDPSNPLICHIRVLHQDGVTTLLNVDLRARNFLVDGENHDNYNGRYIEEFYFPSNDTNLKILHRSWGNKYAHASRGNKTFVEEFADTNINHSDIQVYWYGNCDMWIDYVRVDNDVADELFKGVYDNTWIKNEVDLIGLHQPVGASSPAVMKYYLEYIEFNNLPIIKYVNDRLRQYSDGQIDIMQDFCNTISWHVPLENRPRVQSADFLSSNYVERAGYSQIFAECYPFIACYDVTDPNNQPFSKIPNTLINTSGSEVLGKPVPPSVYDSWLQNQLFHSPSLLEGGSAGEVCSNYKYQVSHPGFFRYIMQTCDSISKKADVPFIFMPQAHQNYEQHEVEREPTNEELEMMTNLALSYGAKGLLYFSYLSWSNYPSYARGIANPDGNLRELNVYGEENPNKKQTIQNIVERVGNKWGPTLLSFDNANRHSYIYNFSEERSALNSNSYFYYFASFKYGSGTPDCGNQEFTPDNIPSGFIYDCADSTYLQIATFENNETFNKYFMVVNRRCSPVNSNDSIGGKRKVRAYIKSNYFDSTITKNWSIVNCEDDSIVAIFPAHNPGYVNLDWFMPGEGKLFKIVPITETGGMLVCDEHFSSSLTVKKNIYNNGYNVSLGTGANLSFEDSAGIYMNGGVLKIGNESQTYGTNLQIKGTSSNKKWQGLVLEDCDTVLICGVTFSNVLPNQPAINLTNCFHFKIMNNLFNCASSENSGGIYADFSETPDGDGDSIYQYIGYNTFSFNGSTNNAVQVVSTASPEIPLFIEGNQFNTGAGSSSSSGIFLSNITGGAIKQNQITNYLTSITLVSSSCDFFGNTISSNIEDAKGIYLVLGDFGGAPSSNGNFVGGYNELMNLNSNSVNIQVENSYFDIDEGYNTFDIDFSNSQRHILGYFPSSANQFYKATYNCFKNNSVQDTASIYVTQGSGGDRITFDTDPYYCGSLEFSGFDVFSLAGGIKDTIFYKTGGTGGGQKEGQAMAIETISGYLLLKDSIELNLRKRNYILTESQCKRMLLTYPDSVTSVCAISKLYLSSLSLDSAGIHIQATKTFLETLIQNNPNNIPLIKKANYFVQKCKVSLKQYSSALQGFQEIINQNPYSYEGLIASWDYAATTLLMGSGGEFNEETKMKTIQNEKETMDFDFLQIMLDSLRNKKTVINSYTNENYDQKKFSKQDREIIKTNVENAFTNERTKQIEKLKDLEKKITTLSNSTSKTDKKKNEIILSEAKKELNTLKVLGEVVKTKKPKNIVEHKNIVNADIKKVFNIYKVTSNKETNSQIPTQYNLSQNYPNPFNPITKINYELPKDGRVKLVIYDILGREIKTLVNELKQAGRYTIEFNGNNYASGVYFYRIQVEDGKSFTAVKKMVLIK